MTDPFDPWWDDEEEEDDEFDDEFEPYTIFWPSVAPYDMEKTSKWLSLRRLDVEATEDEAYVFWQMQVDGVSQAASVSRIGETCFDNPSLIPWHFVKGDGRLAEV